MCTLRPVVVSTKEAVEDIRAWLNGEPSKHDYGALFGEEEREEAYAEYANEAEALDAMRSAFAEWEGGLTAEEKATIWDWTSSQSADRDANYLLRGLSNKYQRRSEEEIRAFIGQLDQALANARLSQNTTLVRFFSPERHAGMNVGDILEDLGFTSTSARQDFTWGGVKVKILAPQGTKGAFIGNITKHANEAEVLLTRGTKFEVIHKGTGRYDAMGNIDFTILRILM